MNMRSEASSGLSLPEIKKIEVWKGPASAIYGFNAFDGVVNIVTKSPAEMKGKTNGSFVQFAGGEFGTIRSAAIQAGTTGSSDIACRSAMIKVRVGVIAMRWPCGRTGSMSIRNMRSPANRDLSSPAGWSIPIASMVRFSMCSMNRRRLPPAM